MRDITVLVEDAGLPLVFERWRDVRVIDAETLAGKKVEQRVLSLHEAPRCDLKEIPYPSCPSSPDGPMAELLQGISEAQERREQAASDLYTYA